MSKSVSLFFMASCVICVAAFAAETAEDRSVEGTWLLVKSVDGKEVSRRPGKMSPTPEGVGFKYLNDGEFRVPGESSGSKRFTLPKGLHFRIEPQAIDKNGAVADLLLSHTELKKSSETGYVAEKHQVEGRYQVAFDQPCTMTLDIAELKTKYILTIKLRDAR